MDWKEGLVNPEAAVRFGIQQLRSPLYRNSIILILISFSSAFLTFIFWVIAARYYSNFDVGVAAALVSASGLLSLISSAGFDLGLIRFLPHAKDTRGMINSCFTFSGLAAVVLSLIFIAGLPLWSPDLLLLRGIYLFILFVVAAAAGVISLLQLQVFTALRRPEYGWVQQAVFSVVRIPLVIALVSFNVTGIWASWTIALCLGILAGNILLIKVSPGYRPSPTIHRKIMNEMSRFSFGNYIANLAGTAPIYILPLMVLALLGAEANAYFYIGFRTGSLLFSLSLLVATSLFVEGSHTPERLRLLSIRSAAFTFALLLPALAICFIFGREILLLFGREYSQQALWIFWLVALSAIPYTFNETYLTIKRVQLQVSTIIYFSVFVSAVTIGIAYPLVMNAGLTGAGLSWLVGHGIATLWVGWWLIRTFSRRKRIDIEQT